MENDSILLEIKKLLGYNENSTGYDEDIRILINSNLPKLFQLGVGPDDGFEVTGEIETWTDLLGDNKHYNMVKEYIFLNVKLAFDPPQNSFLVSNIQDILKELEFRLTVSPKLT